MKSFSRIFRESFAVAPDWADWFVGSVARSDDLVAVEHDGHVASVALVSPYVFDLQGTDLGLAYINSVATARQYRGHGLGSRAVERALQAAAERGDALAALIPADRSLYFFYDRFGFATVFYDDEMRYTSVHRFDGTGYAGCEPTYALFSALEGGYGCTVRHSEADFANIMRDMSLSGNGVVAVADGAGGAAMAFVEPTPGELHVLALPATSDTAAEAALAAVRARWGERPVIVRRAPGEGRAYLRAKGMARIVNVPLVLGALAAADPAVDQVIRVHDHRLPTNDGTYIVRRGECTRVDSTQRRVTLEVTADVLTRIIFSAPATGAVFGLRTRRPRMSLMLE